MGKEDHVFGILGDVIGICDEIFGLSDVINYFPELVRKVTEGFVLSPALQCQRCLQRS